MSTKKLLNTKSYGSSPKHNKAMYGTVSSDSITPTYGNINQWSKNLTHTGSGDISDSWKIETDVGKTYTMINLIGSQSGFYPPGRLLMGFSFSHAQNSTASRAVWLKGYGAMSSAGKLWSSGFLSKQNDYNSHSKEARFDSNFMQHLRDNDRYVEYIAFLFSTAGGSSSRKTACTINNFKFTWVDVPRNQTLILPKLRNYSERNDINAIA